MRKSFVKKVLIVFGMLALFAALCCLDAFYIEPNFPRVLKQDISIPDLPEPLDGLRIVQLSDLHIVRLGKREARALRLIERVKPDLILLTGDYIEDDGITPGEHTPTACAKEAARFASHLHARCGVYGVRGNWDPPWMTKDLERACVRTIDGAFVTFEVRGMPLTLACASVFDPDGRGAPPDRAVPTIVLTHYPDTADRLAEAGAPVDIVLAGHWHGGQVCWPFFGPFDASHMKYPAGLYPVGDIQLYVSRGLGMHSSAVRFNCPSEVTLITLRRR